MPFIAKKRPGLLRIKTLRGPIEITQQPKQLSKEDFLAVTKHPLFKALEGSEEIVVSDVDNLSSVVRNDPVVPLESVAEGFTPEALELKTKDELFSIAAKRGLTVAKRSTKQEIITEILEG